jgi:hypothetical protein
MPKRIIVIGFIVIIASVKSLGQGVACDSVYTFVDQMPAYGTGIREFYEYFGKNLKFTKPCRPEHLTGVSWTISKEGQMVDIVVTGIDGNCRSSILEQLKTFLPWIPGKQNGKRVCVRMFMPIHIRGTQLDR